MISSDIQASSSAPPVADQPNPTAPAQHGFSFHDLLSDLNPLQYLPVVGTIYRAVTGDVIPEMLRRAGSLLVSGLLGGPIGVATNLATTAAEKVSGIDPEKLVAKELGIAPATATAQAETPLVSKPERPGSGPPPVERAAQTLVTAASEPERTALSPQQLAAYGVNVSPAGSMTLGNDEGADVLNGLELARLAKTAAAAYAANQIKA